MGIPHRLRSDDVVENFGDALVSVGHHLVVQFGDLLAARFDKQKWEDAMHQAGGTGDDQPAPKRRSMFEMLKIGLTHRGGMLCEWRKNHVEILQRKCPVTSKRYRNQRTQ